MTIYATKVTPYFAERVAAWQAGSGVRADLHSGVLVIGDGDGAVPTISALLAADGVTHEVWRGETVGAVQINADKPNQIDVECIIPAALGGVEIGPFMVREFAILDEAGETCVVGTTTLEKTTSQQGQVSDFAFIASIVVTSTDAVIVTPPSAGFASQTWVSQSINERMPSATAPLTQTDSTPPSGVLSRVFGLRAARQPAPAVDAAPAILEADSSGYGRPATDAEFAAGASAGGFAWPWATLAQIKAALTAITLTAGAGVLIVARAIKLAFHTLAAGVPADTDVFAYSDGAGAHKKITLAGLAAIIGAIIGPTVTLFRPSWPVGSVVIASSGNAMLAGDTYSVGAGAHYGADYSIGGASPLPGAWRRVSSWASLVPDGGIPGGSTTMVQYFHELQRIA